MKKQLPIFLTPPQWLLPLLLLLTSALHAHVSPDRPQRPVPDQVSFRNDCANAVTQIDQQINNVRARLTTGGDIWWDGSEGRYIIPKPPPGVPGVSSIFAGGIWMGGKDPGGNIKLAAQTYGRGSGLFDYYPGPLNEDFSGGPLIEPTRGTTNAETCALWDKFFIVNGTQVDAHIQAWRQAERQGLNSLDPANIPTNILGWPARGNPFFKDIHQFPLPNTLQGLAGFWDQDFDGIYEPDEGDYPTVEIRGCLDQPASSPDEIIFWIFNDAGNDHRETGSANKMQMEIQVQAFAYRTNDDLNNMTFQRYKLINRAIERLDSTYFGLWIDADLGCYTDDYIGCDIERSLAYVYNADEVDGTNGCLCDQGVNTYCDEIPILGIDYFRGPLNEVGEELGMSSFTYMNSGPGIGVPGPLSDPQTTQEYYNYLSGRWRDGQPLTYGGDGYMEDGPTTSYAFSDPPNDPDGWSMCAEGSPVGDRRTVQASGPFTLFPGAVNELIFGVIWVPDQAYPCPRLDRLMAADNVAQELFNNCIHFNRGPDAPDVDWIELDREIVAVFFNDPSSSNNAFEGYREEGRGIPTGQDSLFRFEGYQLYQYSGPDVTLADRDDPKKVRLVCQVDRRNDVTKIFSWEALSAQDGETPTAQPYFVPQLEVDGTNTGIRHTFRITEDQFAEGDRRLVNHRKYYFAAVAYAHNNYQDFNPDSQSEDPGQDRPYFEGTRNIGDGENGFYTVIPRRILDRKLHSRYGDGAVVTRLDGVGTGKNFLDLSEATRTDIEQLIREDDTDSFSGELTYRGGFGPITVSIFNPLDVIDGEYLLTFTDDNLSDDLLEAPTRWTLRSLSDASAPVITADQPIAELNEQIIRQFGFSVTVVQAEEPGSAPNQVEDNGVIGYAEDYAVPEARPWLFGIRDELPISTGNPVFDASVFNFLSTTNSTDTDYLLDPNQALSTIGNGFIVPYYLADWRDHDNGIPYLTPAYVHSLTSSLVRDQSSLANLNNVDIVFTSDKSLWSRCIVVETAHPAYEDAGYSTEGERAMFDLRDSPSVGKEADENGRPKVDPNPPAGEEESMGWFPGYAIDVETGLRLNIFFGENSVYNGDQELGPQVGGDLAFNPTSEFFFPTSGAPPTLFNYPIGGQHYLYVTKQAYDRCAELRNRLSNSGLQKLFALREITWAGMLLTAPGGPSLTSYEQGLIPSDVTVKLRVNNSYQVAEGTGQYNGYPTYRFRLEGRQATTLDEVGLSNALQAINVVPNPYYAFSGYENNPLDNIVKITNLPARCTVTIYSLAGKFIRRYERNQTSEVLDEPHRAIDRTQINPDLEWDLKNFRQISIASGVYLIHVSAPGLGERTLKWFGVKRQFDSSM